MRKDSECPNLELDRLAKISHAIKDITITNESYRYYDDVKKAFVYLDPLPPPPTWETQTVITTAYLTRASS